MNTGGTEKATPQKNSPLGINDKTKKKKKILVRVSTLFKNTNPPRVRQALIMDCHLQHRETVEMPLMMKWFLGKHGVVRKDYIEMDQSLTV